MIYWISLYPKCQQKAQAIQWAYFFIYYMQNLEETQCENYKRTNVCHSHWTVTVSLKWITVIVAKKKKKLFTHSPQKIIVTINRSILYDAWDLSITHHLILDSWHSSLEVQPASTGENAGAVARTPTTALTVTKLSQLPFPTFFKRLDLLWVINCKSHLRA